MTETELANYKTIDTSTYPLYYGASGYPYVDYQYTPDRAALANHGSMYHSSGYVWLASRGAGSSNSYSIFFVRRMYTSGDVNNNMSLYYAYSDGSADTSSLGYGVRPVVSLKSGITVTGGSGTASDPYIIQ